MKNDEMNTVTILMKELNGYAEMQGELWDRCEVEVEAVNFKKNTITGTLVLEDDMGYGRTKRLVYAVAIRWDGDEDFTYNVETVKGEEFYACDGWEREVKQIRGLC